MRRAHRPSCSNAPHVPYAYKIVFCSLPYWRCNLYFLSTASDTSCSDHAVTRSLHILSSGPRQLNTSTPVLLRLTLRFTKVKRRLNKARMSKCIRKSASCRAGELSTSPEEVYLLSCASTSRQPLHPAQLAHPPSTSSRWPLRSLVNTSQTSGTWSSRTRTMGPSWPFG